ncbi:MAG: hypothetical protein AAF456_05200 [Planctomycetota bacterium]
MEFLKFIKAIDHFCGWSDVIRLDDVLLIARDTHGLTMSDEDLYEQIHASNDFELAELFINSSGSKALFVWDKRRQNKKFDASQKGRNYKAPPVNSSIQAFPITDLPVSKPNNL